MSVGEILRDNWFAKFHQPVGPLKVNICKINHWLDIYPVVITQKHVEYAQFAQFAFAQFAIKTNLGFVMYWNTVY